MRQYAVTLPVLRNERDALLDGVSRRLDVDRLAPQNDAAAIETVGPEDRPCQLGAPGADQSGDAREPRRGANES